MRVRIGALLGLVLMVEGDLPRDGLNKEWGGRVLDNQRGGGEA